MKLTKAQERVLRYLGAPGPFLPLALASLGMDLVLLLTRWIPALPRRRRVEVFAMVGDWRATDPGEELTVIHEPEWAEDTMVSASEKLGWKR